MKEELEKILFYFQLEVQSWDIGRPIHRTLTKEEALTSIINLVDKEVIGEDYPKDYPYDDPEAIKYFNIEKERQRAKLKGVSNG